MGKSKREYREDEQYGYSSHTSDSSGSSSNSNNSSGSGSEDSNSSERERKRKRVKKSSKQKKAKQESPGEYEPRHDDHKHRSRKHKHHHRKHKHKHRHHRHHRGGEEEHYHARRGSSRDRSEVRRSREDERRGRDRTEEDKAEKERKVKREERKNRERYENRQVKSRWDDDEDSNYDPNKRIKAEPDLDEGSSSREHDGRRLAEDQGGRRERREGPREIQSENGRSRGNSEEMGAVVKEENSGDKEEDEEMQKPNMGLSGKLTEDTNTYNGVVIKYSQPPEARKPKRRWRWYIFKGDEDLPFLPLHRQSAYLIGRDRKVADIPTDHPSCSKQHAVLQYRLVTYNREDGTKGRTVKPYILDLESANGTYVNNRRIEPRRYVELLEKDVVKFGYSSREYILLHEGSKGEDQNAPDTGIDLSPVSLLRS
ncbi:FHA domain-containing protein DDL-like [Penaeus japonicus]|uniref:FHA domain-containing protein DDL-like n=1 Tax=Penaeus japonicus TaxID=27405 RepID=UPI001C70D47F|nr:FHA domain-containing protein DDL-like [Penaeus japonicus]